MVAVNGDAVAVTAGQVLGGRYVLGEVLGSGGMATVYQARDEVLGRDVAVKVLGQQFAGDDAFLARFAREARHAAALSHPRIVTVFDSAMDGTTPYIVMELVPGRSLRQLLDSVGALPVNDVVAIAAAVCDALDAAHTAGLVHRDIKPANIMLSDGQVKVLDFGIARAEGSASGTRTSAVLGTAAYLSPEQAAGRPVGPRADLYSLGCVLFEMLTGEPPFTADTAVGLAYRQVHHSAGLPSARRPGLPARLDWITSQLLAKDPAARPASAAAVKAALEAVQAPDHTAVLAPVPEEEPAAGTKLPPARWRPRLTELVLAVALAATAGALAAVLITGGHQPAARSHPPAAAAGHDRRPRHGGKPASNHVPGAGSRVAAAAGSLVAQLSAGVSDGRLSQQAGQSMYNQLQQVLFSAQASAQQTDQQYAQLVQVYDQYVGQKQITGPAVGALRHDLTALGTALGVP